ncbi:MAG: HipA N-terminal domain-containing protein [Bacteroidota bacterium]
MRKAAVFYHNDLAGVLTETGEGHFEFRYDDLYIEKFPQQCLTFTMPVSNQVYQEKYLFSFFEGLIPEGWLLDVATSHFKVRPNDRMGLLLSCCQNCIGAVSVKSMENDHG